MPINTFTHGHLSPSRTDRAIGGLKVSENEAIRFSKAGLLDLPFVFNQVMDGSIEGVYSERFLAPGGNIHLFKLLFVNLLPFGKLLGKHKIYDFLIFRKGENEIGYAGLYAEPSGAQVIGFFGVDKQFRGKRNGARMLRELVRYLPADAKVEAYTTKYATGMQRLLSHAGFRQVKDDATSPKRLYVLSRHHDRQTKH